jgi:hypothetical protein
MVSIFEEMEAAAAAKAAIEALSIAANRKALDALRDAYHIADVAMTTLSSEGPLNEARHTVGIVLPDLIRAGEKETPPREKIDKANAAVEDWMRLLAH